MALCTDQEVGDMVHIEGGNLSLDITVAEITGSPHNKKVTLEIRKPGSTYSRSLNRFSSSLKLAKDLTIEMRPKILSSLNRVPMSYNGPKEKYSIEPKKYNKS